MEMYWDCANGISGDMTLAALAHLGVNFGPLTAHLAQVGVACVVECREENRAGGPGFRADVRWQAEEQPLRHPADIAAIFRRVTVAERVRERALAVLDALAQAEAQAHRIPVEKVHFHEVGAVDTLVDILGVCWGLEELGVERVTASPLPWFGGSIDCAHGRIPLPAPATACLMQGKPVRPSDAQTELVTPTGAALVHALVDNFADGPQGRLGRLGTGYGSRPAPAGLRIWEVDAAGDAQTCGGREEVCQLECHLDHLSGEELGQAIEALAASPAVLDVLWLAGTGKKNRPSGALRVLCLPAAQEEALRLVFRHTHSLGVRIQPMRRAVLPRTGDVVNCGGERLPAKRYELEGRVYVRAEADALGRCAAGQGLGLPALRFAADARQTLPEEEK